MQQHEIHHFLQRYFSANGCEIIEQDDHSLTVQLSIELDKQLMNRPFYWHYLEKTGGKPEPKILTLITNHQLALENKSGEKIYFGSPRLHQIFASTVELGKYIRLYEQCQSDGKQIPLYPWLGLNVKVSYICDRKKDVFYSLGLQLINGQLCEQFHDRLCQLALTPKIPDYTFTLSPLIMPQSGLKRIEHYLKAKIDEEDKTWAIEANERWQTDLHLLEHFYEDIEEKDDSYYNEKLALQEQYEPTIVISIINGGLFYLKANTV